MSELSFMGKLMQAMELSKMGHVGMELTYFDVIELLGEIKSLKSYIAELDTEVTKCHELQDSYCDRIAELEADKKRAEAMVERLIESGKPIAKYLEHVDYRADTFIEIVAEWQARNE